MLDLPDCFLLVLFKFFPSPFLPLNWKLDIRSLDSGSDFFVRQLHVLFCVFHEVWLLGYVNIKTNKYIQTVAVDPSVLIINFSLQDVNLH